MTTIAIMPRAPLTRSGKIIAGITLLYVLIAVLIGAATGLGIFTFGYADGAAYMTNNPEACVNCHVMREQFDGWVKSSHGKFATCNDCHAPHNFVGKYYCKSRNGFFHSLAFTTGNFPDQIQMHEYNRGVVEQNCRRCHERLTHDIDPLPGADGKVESNSCIRCHSTVGHDS
jgi:cytochrome c nitrite reductase small subunit